jgi:predicted outer membrane repeat protein
MESNMSLNHCLSSFLRPSPRPASRRNTPAARPVFRPTLEALESRQLFSTLTVVNNLDSGAGSLRAEIAAAHSNDTIVFAAGMVGQTITLTKGELLINKNLTIAGPGAGSLTASGNHASRVFEVAAGTQVTLTGLTISNGLAAGADGGAILNSGTLTVSGSTLSGNSTTDRWKGNNNFGGHGGGIYNSGTLTFNGNSNMSANTAIQGGGINNAGILSFSNSALLHNTSSGIYNSGTATVSDSVLSGNSASSGAAIWSGGTLTVSGCTLSNNVASSTGGAIANMGMGTLSVSGSSFSDNSASNNGGGIFNQGTLTLSGSTLIGNSAGNDGGGICNGYYAAATVGGCTVSANSASQGGGIWNWHNALTVENSSDITGNIAPVGFGADVYNLGVLYLDNTSTIGLLNV